MKFIYVLIVTVLISWFPTDWDLIYKYKYKPADHKIQYKMCQKGYNYNG